MKTTCNDIPNIFQITKPLKKHNILIHTSFIHFKKKNIESNFKSHHFIAISFIFNSHLIKYRNITSLHFFWRFKIRIYKKRKNLIYLLKISINYNKGSEVLKPHQNKEERRQKNEYFQFKDQFSFLISKNEYSWLVFEMRMLIPFVYSKE